MVKSVLLFSFLCLAAFSAQAEPRMVDLQCPDTLLTRIMAKPLGLITAAPHLFVLSTLGGATCLLFRKWK